MTIINRGSGVFAALVFRTGLINGLPRGRSTFWCETHPYEWYRANYKRWTCASTGVDAAKTIFRMTSAPSTHWIKSDPSNLKDEEEFIRFAPLADQPLLMEIRSQMLLDLEKTALSFETPFVLSSDVFGPMELVECDLKLSLISVMHLPDARLYLQETGAEQASTTLLQHPIPSQLWLPASIRLGSVWLPSFYRLFSSDNKTSQMFLPKSKLDNNRTIELWRNVEYMGQKEKVLLGKASIL